MDEGLHREAAPAHGRQLPQHLHGGLSALGGAGGGKGAGHDALPGAPPPTRSRHGIWHMADRRHMRHMCISSMCFHLVKQETCPLGLLLVTTSP